MDHGEPVKNGRISRSPQRACNSNGKDWGASLVRRWRQLFRCVFPAIRPSISTRPTVCPSISWSMLRAIWALLSIWRDSSGAQRGAGPRARLLEGREPEDRPARRSAICRRRCSKATGSLTSTNCEVLAIVKGGVGVPAAKAGDEVEVVLDHTSFYGDSGGQVGDLGLFLTLDGNSVRLPRLLAACCRCRACGRTRRF